MWYALGTLTAGAILAANAETIMATATGALNAVMSANPAFLMAAGITAFVAALGTYIATSGVARDETRELIPGFFFARKFIDVRRKNSVRCSSCRFAGGFELFGLVLADFAAQYSHVGSVPFEAGAVKFIDAEIAPNIPVNVPNWQLKKVAFLAGAS